MNTTINPTATYSNLHAMISAIRHVEQDNALQTKAEAAKILQLQAIANRLIVDVQNTDPYWINSVNYVASYSRHNYHRI
jgi:hypothetical protein